VSSGPAGARAPLIAVCGASVATPTEAAVAESVGRLLAARGVVVVCGGRGGVMEAACRGVAEGGGTSIGLLPGDDPAEANPHVTLALATGMGELRNGLIARVARGMVVVGGGLGTLSEIAFMLRLGRPLAAVGSWRLVPRGAADDVAGMHRAKTAAEAVEWVLARV
jgi:uncharacterized protein (TIGR00725 family)